MAQVDKPTFSNYGVAFQRKIIQALLTDKNFAEQMSEVVDVSYFDLKSLQFLADRYFQYARKYKDFPTLPLLISIIRNDLKSAADTALRDQIIEFLKIIKTNPDPGDLPYVKEKSLQFCRKQALKIALEKSVDMMETENYENIVDVIKKAVTVGTTASLGHAFFDDIEARFVASKRDCIPTGIAQLDDAKVLNGGVGGGELASIISRSGGGKSHYLVSMGANGLRLKKNVLHYTMELSEILTGTRYDANICGIDANEVFERKSEVLKFYEENKSNLGRLYIKEYAPNTATVMTLRAHIEKLSMHGFKPDIVLIDYADIMRSTRQYESLRHELKLIYEELRCLAHDLKVPVWTASQSNKDGANSDVIDETNMSEGYGKAFVADIIVTLSRKSAEKASGRGRLYLAKNRAGRDGLLFPVKMDTARSTFEITGEQMAMESAEREDEKDFKTALKKKWEELGKDGIVKSKKDTDDS